VRVDGLDDAPMSRAHGTPSDEHDVNSFKEELV
jgi:hypothetical protein